MATGGYKLVSFSWTGGRSDSILDRTQYILYNFCKAIVDVNAGWDWDSDFCDGTMAGYVVMGGTTVSSSYPNIAYILKHTVNAGTDDEHVYRACIGYNSTNTLTNFRDQDCVPFIANNTTYYNFYGSIYLGMMKDGTFVSDNTYGYIPGSTGQFLKWMHFSMYPSSSNNRYSFASQNTSSVTYTYYALVKGAQIGIFLKSTGWSTTTTNGIKGFLCGEIFKSTGHVGDSNTLACIYLQGAVETGECSYSTSANILAQSKRDLYGGINFWSSSANYDNQCSQIFTSSGIYLEGNNSGTKEHVQLAYDYMQVDNNVCSTTQSPGGRWTPCYVYYYTQDQSTYGVVPGDSFKGFVDTDLLRGVNPQTPFGQVLGTNGEFYHIGGGFAIGWDASNAVFLF